LDFVAGSHPNSMARLEEFVIAAWQEILEKRGETQLAILLPRDLRRRPDQFGECPISEMTEALNNFQAEFHSGTCCCGRCECGRGALALPLCAGARRWLLKRAMVQLADGFDAQAHAPMSLTSLLSLRHSLAVRVAQAHREMMCAVMCAACGCCNCEDWQILALSQRDVFARMLWHEMRASGRSSILAILLPRKLRRMVKDIPECPIEEILRCLDECDDVASIEGCPCFVCTGAVVAAWSLPPCAGTRRRLLMRAIADLTTAFDPNRYMPGDLGRLVAARYASALRARKVRRKAALHDVHATRLRLLRQSSRKRTLRIEVLRDALGQVAFNAMVQEQLDRRRHRGESGEPTSRFAETERWWHSREGQQFSRPPRPPPGNLTKTVLSPCAVGGRCSMFGAGRAPRELRGLTWPLLGRGAEVVVLVPPRVAARAALAAVQWLVQRRSFWNRCTCSASIKVDFDAAAGHRVPRVHIMSMSRGASHLALLDSASLENLRPGEFILSPTCFVQAAGRIVAVTGHESVAVALPRPHDQFDTLLRGPEPPSSSLPVGWDISDAATEVSLNISWWAATPFSSTTLTIMACDDAVGLSDEDVQTALEAAMLPSHQIAVRRMALLHDAITWPARKTSGALELCARLICRGYSSCASFFHRFIAPICSEVFAHFSAMFEHRVLPAAAWGRRVVVAPVREALASWTRQCSRRLAMVCAGVARNAELLRIFYRDASNATRSRVTSVALIVVNSRVVTLVPRLVADAVTWARRGTCRTSTQAVAYVGRHIATAGRHLSEWAATAWRDLGGRVLFRGLRRVSDALMDVFQIFRGAWTAQNVPSAPVVRLARVRRQVDPTVGR